MRPFTLRAKLTGRRKMCTARRGGDSLLLCSLLTVLGVTVLRLTHPEIPRPYRVWAYPLPPLVFAAITIWMMAYLLRSRPAESLSGLATMLVGFALYFFAEKRVRQSA